MIYFFIALAAIFVITNFLNFEVDIKVRIINKKNHVRIILGLFRGLFRKKFDLSLKTLDKGTYYLIFKKTDSNLEHSFQLQEIFDLFKTKRIKYIRLSGHMKYLVSRISIRNLRADMKFGLEDAAQTAIVYGSAITILSSIKGYLLNKYGLRNIRIQIIPFFNERKLDLDLSCIINIRLGHIIVTVFRILLHSIKGGDISGRTSY